jgi:protein-tyrosine phosphatase
LRSIFRRDSLRVGQVASWLQVGPALDGPGYLRLRLQGITHVVDLRDDRCDDPDEMDGLGIRWRRLRIAEGDAPTQKQLADLVHWLDAEADEVPNASLYLHGAAGRGRTATVAIALLMHQDHTLEEAESLVLAVWPAAYLNDVQRAFLCRLAANLAEPSAAPAVGDVSAAGDG